jgi:hypothetical protein
VQKRDSRFAPWVPIPIYHCFFFLQIDTSRHLYELSMRVVSQVELLRVSRKKQAGGASKKVKKAGPSSKNGKKKKAPIIIHGPVSLSVHKNAKTGMQIALFGDIHNNKHECPYRKSDINLSFMQAVEWIVKQHPSEMFDLHLEMEMFMKPKNRTSMEGYIRSVNKGHLFSDVRQELIQKGYLRMSHTNLAIPNLRVHNDDVRTLVLGDIALIRAWKWFAKKLQKRMARIYIEACRPVGSG